MDKKIIKEISSRLDRLERAVFGAGRVRNSAEPTKKSYKGATGGIRLLVVKGFFRQAKTAPAVKNELEKKGYFYRIQVVQTALNRLSGRRGPLSAFEENSRKVYVERK